MLTGKLSDFAGVFLLAMTLAFFMPRRLACVVTAVLFVWWKSPVSQSFVDAAGMVRVIDWSDLLALVMLPLAERLSARPQADAPQRIALACLAALAFAATSPARKEIAIPATHPLYDFDTHRTLAELEKRQKRCHAWIIGGPKGTTFGMSYEHFRLLKHNEEIDANADAAVVNGTVRLHFTKIHVTWNARAGEQSYRSELIDRLRDCIAE